MALQKVEIPILVDGGIDTKTEKKLVQNGKMLKSENVDFSTIGSIKKAKGTIQLTNSTDDSEDLSSKASKIFSHNSELVALGKQGQRAIYSYNSGESQWKGKYSGLQGFSNVPIESTEENELVDVAGCYGVSSAECPTENYKVVSTLEEKGNGDFILRVTKVDYETGEETSNKISLISALADKITQARINVTDEVDSTIFLTYVDDVKMYVAVYDNEMNSIGTVEIFTLGTVPPQPYPSFDTGIIDGKLFVVSHGQTFTKLELAYVDNTATITDSNTYTVTDFVMTYDVAARALNRKSTISFDYDNDNIYIIFLQWEPVTANAYPTNSLYIYAVTRSNLSVNVYTVSSDFLLANVSKSLTRCSIAMTGNANEAVIAVSSEDADFSASSADTAQLSGSVSLFKVNNINNESTITATNITTSNFLNSCQLYSHILFIDGDSTKFYFIVKSLIRDSISYYLMYCSLSSSSEYGIISRFATDAGFTHFTTATFDYSYNESNLNKISKGKDDFYYFPFLKQGEAISRFGGFNTSIPRASTVKLSLGGIEANGNVTKLAQSTHYAGGILTEYNSEDFKNSGFSHPPYITNIYDTAASGSITAGKYLYIAIFKYLDLNGEKHLSAQSNIAELNATNNTIVLTITGSRLALDRNKDGYSFIEIYRTAADSSGPFYFIDSVVQDASLGDVSLTYTDVNADSSIQGNSFIYTSGDVLENSTIPPMTYIASGLDRIFGISAADQNLIYYSQKRIIENAIRWNLSLSFRVDGFNKRSGRAIAVENLDDKMIILKNDSVLAISGDGPLQTGEQNTFTSPGIISQQVGCEDRKSVVATPVGIMFKSKKGIYLVDRTLQVSYVGSGVEEYNSEEILDSDVSTKRNEVYFITSNRLMIYNYLQSKWSTNTYLKGKSLCIWNDNLSVLKADGRIYYQDDSVYKDNGADISMKVTTPWYKTTGITGFGRLYEIMILGEYKSDHTLHARIYYDYDETIYDDYTFTVTTTTLYEFSVKPSKQKCQSFKIEIWDTPTGGTGESFELTGISLRVGAKKGLYKLPDSRGV